MGDYIKKLLINKYSASVVRTALAALGGYLISNYGIDEDLVNELMTNFSEVAAILLPILIAQGWSLVQKYNTK